MAGKDRQKKVELEVEVLRIAWYPSSRCCAANHDKKPTAKQMPPLMVRKAEWRR